MRTDGRTDRHEEDNSFRHFVKAPTNEMRGCSDTWRVCIEQCVRDLLQGTNLIQSLYQLIFFCLMSPYTEWATKK